VASSTPTKLEPKRRHAVPAEPRPPSVRPSRISDKDKRDTGVKENRAAASRDIVHTKATTWKFKPRPCRYGIPAIMPAGMSLVRSCMIHSAERSPNVPPVATSRKPSVAN